MPRMNLRSVPAPRDPDEDLLIEVARRAGYATRLNNRARLAGQPCVELFKYGGSREVPVAVFKRAGEALAWIEALQAEQRR